MEDWKKDAPLIRPEEEGLNYPYLQRLRYNPNYYCPNEEDLNIGDVIVIGTYRSSRDGSPNIGWVETTVKGLPLCNFYSGYITCMKLTYCNI
jgi:hypothetical protein